MADPMMPPEFSVHCGLSPRLIRARRLFIESYLRRHDFTQMHSEADRQDSVVFSMKLYGLNCRLRVSDAWLISHTHARVEERLDHLQVLCMLREHGAACVDVTATGQEILSRF
jgi:hypothetical protein